MCGDAFRCARDDALYGVRVSKIGARLAPFGRTITVWSLELVPSQRYASFS